MLHASSIASSMLTSSQADGQSSCGRPISHSHCCFHLQSQSRHPEWRNEAVQQVDVWDSISHMPRPERTGFVGASETKLTLAAARCGDADAAAAAAERTNERLNSSSCSCLLSLCDTRTPSVGSARLNYAACLQRMLAMALVLIVVLL
mmetsp:Transcript_67340/g.140689  ORF Transcript_67340/g.140689 Transcript_67340/m.140689 type:complete len:148 (+) Transcript_67340:2417-2860(+)